MFDRKKYKKQAVKSLKNTWIDSCLLSVIFLSLCALTFCISSFLGTLIFLITWGILSVSFNNVLIKHDFQIEKISFTSLLNSIETHWIPSILAAFWFFLWTSLWSLLFFIPGIVKGYSYSMMFFVLAENQKIGVEKAMNISKILTQGHKADLFTLHLSFLGWYIVSLCTSGIGFIPLLPYFKVTNLKAYYDLKRFALTEGRLNPADFA